MLVLARCVYTGNTQKLCQQVSFRFDQLFNVHFVLIVCVCVCVCGGGGGGRGARPYQANCLFKLYWSFASPQSDSGDLIKCYRLPLSFFLTAEDIVTSRSLEECFYLMSLPES